MRHTVSLVIALLVLAACGPSGSKDVIRTSFRDFDATYHCIDWKGTKRCYYVVLPKENPKHLLIALHPAFTPVKLTEDVSHLAKSVVPDSYLVVYPEGVDKQWNDSRVMTKVKTFRDKSDDVGFINAVTKKVQKKYGFTPAQTTVAGMSNGGMMSLRMACQSDNYGSVATIVANLPLDLRKHCKASPKPMLMVFGTHDTVVNYSGGVLADSGVGSDWGTVESAKETDKFFATRNGCDLDRVHRFVIGDPQIDETRAIVSAYRNCKAPFISIHVEKMGHTWPGEESRILAFLSMRGAVSHQFDAAKTIEQFVDLLRAGEKPTADDVAQPKR